MGKEVVLVRHGGHLDVNQRLHCEVVAEQRVDELSRGGWCRTSAGAQKYIETCVKDGGTMDQVDAG
jgi:hypothetical protein